MSRVSKKDHDTLSKHFHFIIFIFICPMGLNRHSFLPHFVHNLLRAFEQHQKAAATGSWAAFWNINENGVSIKWPMLLFILYFHVHSGRLTLLITVGVRRPFIDTYLFIIYWCVQLDPRKKIASRFKKENQSDPLFTQPTLHMLSSHEILVAMWQLHNEQSAILRQWMSWVVYYNIITYF